MKTGTSKSDFLCDRLYAKLTGLGGKGASAIKAWQLSRSRDRLESELARIIETANSHKAKGRTPNGSLVYVALRDKALQKISAFCEQWNYDPAEIETQVPALQDLIALSVAKGKTPAGLQLIGALLGGCLLMILIGVASGLVNAGHNWVMHLVPH